MRRTISMVAAIAAVGVFACGANALVYTEMYEMNAAPDAVAGTTFGNVLAVADGTGTNGPSGFTFANGIGTFLDDGASSGNQGYWSGDGTTGAWMQGSGNFTVDFKILVLQDQAGSGGKKSMSFWSGNGRGLQINKGSVQFVSGTGGVGPGWGHDFTQWTDCRVIINSATNMADFYWDEADNNINDGDYTHTVGTTMGGSGSAYDSAINFAIGSNSGSGTTLANFNLDYFRVYSGGTDVNAVYTPEPATMTLLALGAVTMLRRRR